MRSIEEIKADIEKEDRNEFYIEMHDFFNESDRIALQKIRQRRAKLEEELKEAEADGCR